MDLKDKFNNGYEAKKSTPYVLDIRFGNSAGTNYLMFDFMTRTMLARTGSSESGLTIIPFSQLDREMLVAMRDKLKELGGDPPELPAETPANPGNTRQLRP